MTRAAEGGEPIKVEASAVAYPRLFRVFAWSMALAVLSGLGAVVSQGEKGLHPAPFLVLALVCAVTGIFAFVAMLLHLLGAVVVSWWRR